MKFIAGMTAVFFLTSSALAFAQQAQERDDGSIAQTSRGDQQQSQQTEIVEVANPFLAKQGHDDDAAQPLTMKDQRTELKFGPYRRSEYARAPGASVARPGRGAVGVALSFQLGG